MTIPVLNAGAHASRLVTALAAQTLRPDTVLVIDSASDDDSIKEFERAGALIHRIGRHEFDHGGTRNLAFSLVPDADVYIFMTQDAVPARPDALGLLVDALLSRTDAGSAYGRQLAAGTAGAFARHARLFNYPGVSSFRTQTDISRLGVRSAFCSNSFAAYRREALQDVGWFREPTIFGEDTFTVARMLRKGWGICYVADAAVYHSHDYTLRQEFQRYFDVGVSHALNPWFRKFLGGAEGEGLRFTLSELRYIRGARVRMASLRVLVRNALRWLGYRAGRHYQFFPRALRARFGMNAMFWRVASKPSADTL